MFSERQPKLSILLQTTRVISPVDWKYEHWTKRPHFSPSSAAWTPGQQLLLSEGTRRSTLQPLSNQSGSTLYKGVSAEGGSDTCEVQALGLFRVRPHSPCGLTICSTAGCHTRACQCSHTGHQSQAGPHLWPAATCALPSVRCLVLELCQRNDDDFSQFIGLS